MRTSLSRLAIVITLFVFGCSSIPAPENQLVHLPTSAQVTTDLAGKAATAVKHGVLKVICRSTSSGGTGFLHSSGIVLTAAHVVKDCKPQDVVLFTPAGKTFGAAAVDADDALDLALVRPVSTVPGQPLSLAPVAPPAIGMQVATWGYPGGYSGLAPLLSVGYLAGTQEFKDPAGGVIQRWVINAAFNGGNSGGPVLSLEDGSIVGVVSSKLAPVPQEIATILELLSKQQSGFTYEGTKADGSKVTFTEGQLIGEVLQYLRSQVQLVIGYAVSPEDIAKFLKARNIKP
jgi:S1-C subfamily serine protease